MVGIVALVVALGGQAVASGAHKGPKMVRKAFNVAAGSTFSAYAHCPGGQRATGGGVGAHDGGSPDDRVVQDGPVDSSGDFKHTTTGKKPVQWYGKYFNSTTFNETAYVWVLCQ